MHPTKRLWVISSLVIIILSVGFGSRQALLKSGGKSAQQCASLKRTCEKNPSNNSAAQARACKTYNEQCSIAKPQRPSAPQKPVLTPVAPTPSAPTEARCKKIKSWEDKGVLTQNIKNNWAEVLACQKLYPTMW